MMKTKFKVSFLPNKTFSKAKLNKYEHSIYERSPAQTFETLNLSKKLDQLKLPKIKKSLKILKAVEFKLDNMSPSERLK